MLGRDSEAEPAGYSARIEELLSILSAADYKVFRMHKQGVQRVASLQKIDAFPDVVWTHETEHDFDYLMLPVEQVDEANDLVPA